MFAVDSAGSMTIHMFGAYFGLTCAFYYKPKRAIADEFEQGRSNYNSRIIAMIGTLFLFIYWPSFNSALATGVSQQRAAINTFYSITASALMAGFMSRVVKGGKLDMEIIMNATLAGGVMIAASVEMIFNPGYAIIVGSFAGIVSSLAFTKLTPFMETKVRIHDTCGV
jgi:ammonium transporter Rh